MLGVAPEDAHKSYLYFEQTYYQIPWFLRFNSSEAFYWGTTSYTSENCLHHHW